MTPSARRLTLRVFPTLGGRMRRLFVICFAGFKTSEKTEESLVVLQREKQ